MYKYLYKKCLDEKTIFAAWHKLRKGKTKRKDVQRIDNNLEKNIKQMQETIWNTRPCAVPEPQKAFEPPEHKPKIIFEHGKERKIYCPNIKEQWLHHIVAQVLAPIILKKSYKYSCGSVPKRGSHFGKRKMERLVKRGFRNFLKCDIRHFYNNIRLKIVIESLKEEIEDDWFIYLIEVIFKHFKKGLPLGYYLSQWLANFILRDVDKTIIKTNIIGYVRYMDDIIVVDNSKKRLRNVLTKIKKELGKLRLKLKNNYQISKYLYKNKGRCIDFMGFIFKPYATVLRKKTMIKACRCATKVQKAKRISLKQAQSMLSRCGCFKHTNTYNVWRARIEPKINVKQLKRVVSWNIKRRNKREKRMEIRKMQHRTGTVQTT